MPPKRTALLIDSDAERAKLRADRLADVFDVQVDASATGGKDSENGAVDLILVSSSSGPEVPAHDPHSTTCFVILEDDREATDAADFVSAGACDVLRAPLDPADLELRMAAHGARQAAREELELEARDASAMLELTQKLTSSLDFRDILYTVVRRIAEVIRVERVSIVLAPEPEQGDVGYVVVASDDERLTNLRLDLSKYPEIQEALKKREPLTIRDAATHPVLDGVEAELVHSAMTLIPIVWETHAIGVLFVRATQDRGALRPREVHFCQVVANATAVALRNARVMQSLRDHTQQITFARFEAERRLRSLERFADLFASAAEGIAVIDTQGRLLFANPRAHEMLGHPEEDVKGVNLRDIIHVEERARAMQLWRGFARGEFPRGVDVRIVRSDGTAVILSCSFAALAEGDGSVLISCQDVTEQRRTEAELVKTMEFLESLIEASVDGIVAADMDGNIILFNPGAERIYGMRAEEVIGRMRVTELYTGEGGKLVMDRLLSEDYGGAGRLAPMRIDAKSGTDDAIPIQISAAVIYEHGEPSATFGIFTDLREKLRVEKRLAEAQKKLELSERASVLAELAGTAAHELNQPLTSIMAYAELLQRKLEDGSSEHRAASRMVSESQRMADIVRKIGKMTKYETRSYVGDQKILDLDASSGRSEAAGANE